SVPICFFLSTPTATHIDLHSFPTRRSSDLTSPPRPSSRSSVPHRPNPRETRHDHAPTPPRPAAEHPSAHAGRADLAAAPRRGCRSEEHTSELQSQSNLVCRLLLEKKKKNKP